MPVTKAKTSQNTFLLSTWKLVQKLVQKLEQKLGLMDNWSKPAQGTMV